MKERKNRKGFVLKRLISSCLIICSLIFICGCEKRQDAYNNEKMKVNNSENTQEEEQCPVTEIPSESTENGEDVQDLQEPAGTENGVPSGEAGPADNSENQITPEKLSDSTQNNKTVNPNAIVKENATYDCDIKADREAYDGHVDITVGDKFYATQINDWYITFDAYKGKVVEIEGYYIGDFQPYDFVGRYGPSCPYCQGGYVSFEILSDEDLTVYESAKDWIKVTGILREGMDSSQDQPFYYIEALKVEKMDKVGLDTVTD